MVFFGRNIDKKYIIPLLIIVFLTFFSGGLLSKSYKVINTSVKYKDVEYDINIGYYFGKYVGYIENSSNCIGKEPRYKLGSDPVRYYTWATGMGHSADVDVKTFDSIVADVFTQDEIDRYSKAKGNVYVNFTIDSLTGKILEVRFQITTADMVFANLLSMEKIYELEKMFKEKLVCSLSDELKEEKQSYAIAGQNLFAGN
ncbi:MAG: hypothetical protein IJ222_07510 [Bacteroidales bacterium]|nr:hypothetical protein [Bacteroidales bacterium]